MANKDDLKDGRKVTREEGEELARKWDDALFFEVSALTREGLDAAIAEAILEIRSDDASSSDMGWYSATI